MTAPLSSGELGNSTRLNVALGERAYDIDIGAGLLDGAGARLATLLPQPRAIIITDDHVAPLYLQRLESSLNAANIKTDSIVLPHGEGTKDFAHLNELCCALLEKKVERRTTLIALGGGVIGDLVGFAAAITLRGVPFVQIPTTLLAQVDSSVGGKTGINTPQGKNLVGAFYQPLLVLADTQTLDTLPRRQLLSGYAEVVKYGLINDPDFFNWLEENAHALLDGDDDARRHAILTSCAAKAAIVAEDERERGARALLNLGHTFGHALESETGYSDALFHGEAVALGTGMAFRLSERMGLCTSADVERVMGHFESAGLATNVRALMNDTWTADGLLAHMAQDKKIKDGQIAFILAKGIGRAFISSDVSMDDVRAVLNNALGRPEHV